MNKTFAIIIYAVYIVCVNYFLLIGKSYNCLTLLFWGEVGGGVGAILKRQDFFFPFL